MAAFFRSSSAAVPLLGLLLLLFSTTTAAAAFREAPIHLTSDTSCSTTPIVHITMTLDSNYLRGTIAAVNSILQHSSCPNNVVFHFVSSSFPNLNLDTVRSTFPNLIFKTYRFNSSRIATLISKSVRQALDQPLNYARMYLAGMLPDEVRRVIYLDSDLVVIDDIARLYGVDLKGKVLAAPEYCHANLTSYFTEAFWSDPGLYRTFEGRKPCYFNTGVMVMDLEKWRSGDYTTRVEDWMVVQKERRIYQLGSMPPFLLVLAGNIEPVDHRWNQHGLGGDNVNGNCRGLHPGPVSLLHWSGHGKPWLRRDARKLCDVDLRWIPYDLYDYSEDVLIGGHSFAE